MWQNGLVRRSKAGPPILSPPAEPCPAGSGPSARGFFSRFHRSRTSSRHRWSSSNANSLIATASAFSRSGASTEPIYSRLLRMMTTRQLRRLAGFLGLGARLRAGCRQRPGLPARENHRPRPLIAWLSGDREEKVQCIVTKGPNGRPQKPRVGVLAGSDAQCEQCNHTHTDSQHCECYRIVVQPMQPLLHGAPPCSASSNKREGRRDNFLARLEFRCSKRRLTEGMLWFPARDTCFA